MGKKGGAEGFREGRDQRQGRRDGGQTAKKMEEEEVERGADPRGLEGPQVARDSVTGQ